MLWMSGLYSATTGYSAAIISWYSSDDDISRSYKPSPEWGQYTNIAAPNDDKEPPLNFLADSCQVTGAILAIGRNGRETILWTEKK